MNENMEKSNFISGQEARNRLILGANRVADVVKTTLGAAGANFIAEHTLQPLYITSNDGVTLAKAIQLTDPYEQIGARIMQEIATKADKSSQDGTTTAITLAQSILNASRKYSASPMELKRSLEACIPMVELALQKQVKTISESEVGTVASISAEDPSIGAMIQDIYEHIGRDGIIFHDASRDYKDSYTLDKGVHIMDCGMASPYMADTNEGGALLATAELKNPCVLITKQKINSVKELESIGNIVLGAGKKELVIFADEFEGLAVNELVLTRIRGGIRTLLVKLPILWKDWWLEDIAKLTGATVVDPALGLTLKEFKAGMFGTCASVLCDKENTFLNGTLDISQHVNSLMETGEEDSKLRAARLNKKTANYHVGALSEQALTYRMHKVQDALGTAYQALHGGVVAGGGVALRNCISDGLLFSVGGNILQEALQAPIRQIVENAGGKYENYYDSTGFNAVTHEWEDMLEANIVDAYNTVLNSFKSAVSVAATILTASTVVLLPKEEKVNPFNPYESVQR